MNIDRGMKNRQGQADPSGEGLIDPLLGEEFSYELYGLLVSLTEGKAKGEVKSVSEICGRHDGLRSIVMLDRKFNVKQQGVYCNLT